MDVPIIVGERPTRRQRRRHAAPTTTAHRPTTRTRRNIRRHNCPISRHSNPPTASPPTRIETRGKRPETLHNNRRNNSPHRRFNMGGTAPSCRSCPQAHPRVPTMGRTTGGRDLVKVESSRQATCPPNMLEAVSTVSCQPVRGPSIDPQHSSQRCNSCARTARIRHTCAAPLRTVSDFRRGSLHLSDAVQADPAC